MELKPILKLSVLLFCIACISACGGDKDSPAPDKPKKEDPPFVDILPDALAEETYSPSLNSTRYRPIEIEYYDGPAPNGANSINWSTRPKYKTRILPYMVLNFTPDTTVARYASVTNKYGSSTTRAKHTATGRFYTKKIKNRWWIIDPEGYIHYERSVTSVRRGSSTRNKNAWNLRFGTETRWMNVTQKELSGIGFHGTGAFCSDTYSVIQTHNQTYPDRPMTLAPSFSFLGAFRRECGKNSDSNFDGDKLISIIFCKSGNKTWEDFCKEYVQGSTFDPYRGDRNVLGFFSDNEIPLGGSSYGNMLLESILNMTDKTNDAYKFAAQYAVDNGIVKVEHVTNQAFVEMVMDKYYGGIKNAIKAVDPGMMYLGSRLYSHNKYWKSVIQPAGRHCDIISINYYSRWSPELTDRIKEWEEWTDTPWMVTEFYTKGIDDSDLNNKSGAGISVKTQKERAYAYQHFTLGLLEAKHCIGWHWFKYQDDDGTDNDSRPANKGVYDNYYNLFPYLSMYMRAINFNAYELTEFFDKTTY